MPCRAMIFQKPTPEARPARDLLLEAEREHAGRGKAQARLPLVDQFHGLWSARYMETALESGPKTLVRETA